MLSGDDDMQYLTRDLQQCRLDLASARERLEPLGEELAAERFRRQALERRVDDLANELDRWLLDHSSENRPTARIRRLLTRRRALYGEETRQAERIRQSALFSNGWYLTHYPEVIGSGLSPALHYLRHGAQRGFNPSAEFTTRAYLRDHPAVARSGQNPLLHYLESTPGHGHEA